MGRAVETNLYCAMTCDALKLGMVKHPEVWHHPGGRRGGGGGGGGGRGRGARGRVLRALGSTPFMWAVTLFMRFVH